jgi:hypothetical protein
VKKIDTFRETSDYSYFSSSVPQYIVDYLSENGNAIAILPYGIVMEHENTLATTPLSTKMNNNNGTNPPKVMPDPTSVEAGLYPLVQSIYMNLNANAASRAYSLPYMEFGLSPYGQRLVELAGHVPLSNQTLREMQDRLTFLTDLSMDESNSNTTTEPPIFSPGTQGGQDTSQPAPTTRPSPGTASAVASIAPTTQPASLPPATNQSGGTPTVQLTITETPANETADYADSVTRESSSGESLRHSHSLLGSTLAIAALLFS